MPVLDREEYIEQAYFFSTFLDRLIDQQPAQEVLDSLQEEVLAITRLPLALNVLRGELRLKGRLSAGMAHLPHYFTPFQTYVMEKADEDRSKFDQRIALQLLAREAAYKAESPTPAGLFVYHFECLCRNRLGYDRGMLASASDPFFNKDWRDYILRARMQLGTIDFADLIYARSEEYVRQRERDGFFPAAPMAPPDSSSDDDSDKEADTEAPRRPLAILFNEREGRIARANRGKDPLYLFAALQRQLGYPAVPRPTPAADEAKLPPQLELRLERLEKRLQLLEGETSGKLDLSQFYAQPPKFPDDPL